MTINGCSLYFDGTWKSCCDAHDIAFTIGGNLADLINANWSLITCVSQLDLMNGIIMGVGVTLGGWFVWPWAKLKYKSFYSLITGKEFDK